MSVYKTDYVVVGVDVIKQIKEMSDESFEYLETLVEDCYGLEMIYDGMSGEYCIIGKVLSKVEEYEEMSKIIGINPIDLEFIARDVEEEIESNLFPIAILKDLKIELKIFSHYH